MPNDIQAVLDLCAGLTEEQFQLLPPADQQYLLYHLDLFEKEKVKNPLAFFIPNGAQEEFINALGDHPITGKKIFIVTFANSVGKTGAMIAALGNLIWGTQSPWFDKPLYRRPWPYPKKFWYVSETDSFKTTISDEFERWFPAGKYEFTKAGRPFKSHLEANGWTGDFKTFDQDASQFETATLGAVIFDEPPPKNIFDACVARLRMGGVIIFIMTPLAGSAWIFDELIDKSENADKVQVFYADIEQNCFPASTEYLTRDGWRRLGDARVGDYALTFDPSSRHLEYQPVQATIKRMFNGELCDLGVNIGLSATPDHRILTFNEHGMGKARQRTVGALRPKFYRADRLYRGMRLPAYGQYSQQIPRQVSPFPELVSGRDWCEFMGWYLSEGCAVGTKGGRITNYGIMICQSVGPKRDRIRELLGRTGWKWNERKSDFYACDKLLHAHLLPLGVSHEKYIPSYMYDYPVEWLEVMAQSLLDGDGDGVSRYVTVSERLADDVQRLFLLLGYPASVRRWEQSGRRCHIHIKSYAMRDQFCVKRLERRDYYVNRKSRLVPYRGEVACVSVPAGTIVVRDPAEKYPLITGNCRIHGKRGRLAHSDIEFIVSQYDEDEREARAFGRPKHLSGVVYKTLHAGQHRRVLHPLDFKQENHLIYCGMDIHDRRPPAIVWIASGLDGKKVIIDEFPNFYDDLADLTKLPVEAQRLALELANENPHVHYHKLVSTRLTFDDIGKIIRWKEEKNGWTHPEKILRVMDPNAGRRRVGAMGKTIQLIFSETGIRLKWPLNFITDVNDALLTGHAVVRNLLKLDIDRSPNMIFAEHCENSWHQMARYAHKKPTARKEEADGVSQLVEQKYKDFPDAIRYPSMIMQTPIKEQVVAPKPPDEAGSERDRGRAPKGPDLGWRDPRKRRRRVSFLPPS